MSKSAYSRLRHRKRCAFKKYMKFPSRKAWKRYIRFEKVPLRNYL